MTTSRERLSILPSFLPLGLTAITAALAVLWALTFQRLAFPHPSFGVIPVLAGLLPGFLHLLYAPSTPLFRFLPKRWTAPLLFALAYLPSLVLDRLGMVGTAPGLWDFTLSAFLGFLFGGLPLVGIGEWRSLVLPHPTARDRGTFLLVLSAALLLSLVLPSGFFTVLPFLAPVVFALMVTLFRGPEEGLPSPPDSDPPHRESDHPSLLHLLPILGVLLLTVLLLNEGMRAILDQGLADPLLPALPFAALAALAVGVLAGRRASGSVPFLIPVLLLPGSVLVGMLRWRLSLFSELYLAWSQDAGGATGPVLELGLWTLVLPAFFVGILFSSRLALLGNSRSRLPGLATTATLALGFALPALVDFNSILPFLLAALALLGAVDALMQKGKAAMGSALLAALPIIAAFTLPTPGFHLLVEPTTFRVEDTRRTAFGTLSRLKNRDDDDPFAALLWRQTSALTHTGRDVYPVLARLTHLPLLLHPHPRSVLVLGLGSGTALTAAALHEVEVLECVEPSVDVLDLILPTLPTSVRNRVRVHRERCEDFLARDSRRWDVILLPEPLASPLPEVRVYMPTFAERVRARLTENGILAQGVSLSRIPDDQLSGVASSLVSSLPFSQCWIPSIDPINGMILVLGSARPISVGPAQQERFTRLLRDPVRAQAFATLGLTDWDQILAEYGGPLSTLHLARGPLSPWKVVDHIPEPNASAPRMKRLLSLLPPMTRGTDGFTTSLPDSLLRRAQHYRALRPALFAILQDASSLPDSVTGKRLMALHREVPGSMDVRFRLSHLLERQASLLIGSEQYLPALGLLEQITRLVPLRPSVLRLFMIAYMSTGQEDGVKLAIEGLKRLSPRHAGVKDNQGSVRARQGRLDDASLLFQAAIGLDPTQENFYINLAALQASTGHTWEALNVLLIATQQAWYPPKAHYLRGAIYVQIRRGDLARQEFRAVFRTAAPGDPVVEATRKALAELP